MNLVPGYENCAQKNYLVNYFVWEETGAPEERVCMLHTAFEVKIEPRSPHYIETSYALEVAKGVRISFKMLVKLMNFDIPKHKLYQYYQFDFVLFEPISFCG